MQFGIFYEHQYPRPWHEGGEHQVFREALEQVEVADRIGIDYAWEVEHHFLEEYSHSSAPEVFLAACSQRTRRIRLGHGIVLLPPAYNPPARVAERIATLDLVSDGRVEFGTGESASLAELGGFGIPVETKRDQWLESLEQIANMMAMDPYPGFEGKYFSMPCRNVVPKPLQRPHPPLWVACSNRETIHLAARLGLGALTFAFVDTSEAAKWVSEYYEIIRTDCTPIGHAVNANVAMVTGFGCHEDGEEARRRMEEGFLFFGYSLGHHYIFGTHKPGRTDVWDNFQKSRHNLPASSSPGIGSPDQIAAHLRGFEEAGVDQVIFIQQGGKNRHEHICESLELFAERVLPEFKEREESRLERKRADLGEHLERALARKRGMQPLDDPEIPELVAMGRQVAERGQAQRIGEEESSGTASGGIPIPLEDPASSPSRG